jgi:ATP-dependent RNA helicase DDX46/PRP5
LTQPKSPVAALSTEEQRAAEREAEQAALDEEIRRRRERVRAWQEARMKASGGSDNAPLEIAQRESDGSHAMSEGVAEASDAPEAISIRQDTVDSTGISAEESSTGQKGWSLEDEVEDEEGPAPDLSAAPDVSLDEVPLPPLVASLPHSGSSNDLAADTEVFSSLPVVNNRKINGPSSITVALTPGQTKSAASNGAPVKSVPAIKAPELNRASISGLKPIVNSRFSAKPSSTKAPESISITPVSTDSRTNDDDYDPLDDFMSDLYGSGDVVEQKKDVPKAAAKLKPVLAAVPSSKMELDSAFGADADDENNGSDDDDDIAPLNPYGSNFITLEDILGGTVPGTNSASGRPKLAKLSNGWDSDSTAASPMYGDGNPQETEEEREEREERERQEFLQALRRAHEEEERESKSKGPDLAAEEGKKPKEQDLGRVFASEGDVLDEFEVEEKKKSALELLEEQRKGKELKPVDHSQIEYIPFRKNLYIVPRQLAKLDENEVKLRREALNVKVRGKGCPCPVDTWEQCGLADRILGVIEKSNFKAPFAIQKQALPAIMCGRDVIGVAKTGSGKTLAFLLPMLRHIMDQPPLGEGEGPIGLIMAPARELAFQIFNEAKKFCKPLGLRVACIYGGAGIADQIAELKRGADIVVCTPGRMIDILTMQAGKMVSLKRVSMVVMDEADRMFDMGFEPQIRMIIQNIRPDRQTVLFSATFPKQIEKLAKSVLKFPLEIVIGERSVANKDITQFVELHDEGEKFLRLLQLLGIWNDRGSVLIFVDKQDKCDQLFQDLLKAGYPCLSLHGGKDQIDRDHTLHEFKSLIKTVMVATSVAGRGLDVPEIVCVINYNCPNHIEDYVHRIGRTGRAGRKGTAYTFISTNEEQYAPLMCKALEQAEQPVPIELQAMADRFKEKVNRGEAHWVGSGFVGKGFTFDASEMNEAQKLASMQRRAYEIEQGIAQTDGKEEEEDADAFYDEKFGDLGAEGEAVEAPSAAPASDVGVSSDSAAALEKARLLAASIAAGGVSLAAIPPDASAETKAALARAKLIAMTMGTKAGADETPQHFSDEFDINDYPAQVRLSFRMQFIHNYTCRKYSYQFS